MSVRIRLSRHGKKKAPFYRLVVTDSHSPRDGRFIEILGTYNPITTPAEIKVDNERAAYWLSKGATPSDTAKILLQKTGVLEAPVYEQVAPKAKLSKKAQAKAEAAAKAAAEAAAQPAEEAAE